MKEARGEIVNKGETLRDYEKYRQKGSTIDTIPASRRMRTYHINEMKGLLKVVS